MELRKRAEDPAVQAKLAPFITPGYWWAIKSTIDKQPLSFSELVNYGALAVTPDGLDKLVFVGTNLRDRVRPRWDLNRQGYRNNANQLEMVKAVQKLLIELGPVLVEMKLLTP